ncbi:MAG: gamma-glutamylcyclotransferase family protein [Thermoanaerobaculia bacterium]
MVTGERPRIFVYGTLRSDPAHEMFHLLAKHARFVGDATVPGHLFDLGDYPGMISSDDGSRVFGEVYELASLDWQRIIGRLDEYEGCSPSDPEPREYRREVVKARLASGDTLPAWAYVLNRWPAGFREIESGDYLAARART